MCKFFAVHRAPSAIQQRPAYVAGGESRDDSSIVRLSAVPNFLLTNEELQATETGAEADTTFFNEAASSYTDDDVTSTTSASTALETNKKSTPSKRNLVSDRSPKKPKNAPPAFPAASKKGASVATGSTKSKNSGGRDQVSSPYL